MTSPLSEPHLRFIPGRPAKPPRYHGIESPLGEMLLVSNGDALTGVYVMQEHRGGPTVGPEWRRDPGCFDQVVGQLHAYFAGELTAFDLTLAPNGTPFQRTVWQTLASIRYGTTASYGDIAKMIDHPTAARAVGAANGRNPISVIVPCHRIIGSNGHMVGYGGGLHRKEWLLRLEGSRQRGDGSDPQTGQIPMPLGS